MSTEREAISIIGYTFTHQELLSLMEIHNKNYWEEDWIKENEKYHAELGETFANCFDLHAHYNEDYEKCHYFGFKMESELDYVEAINLINEKSILLMEFFKTDVKPKIYFEIYSC